MESEKQIETLFNNFVKSVGGKSIKLINHTGIMDRLAIFPNNNIWFVELKRPDGKMSKIQKWRRKELKRLHCKVILIHNKRMLTLFKLLYDL